MPDAIIENPILNSPFDEPRRHFKFDKEAKVETARRLWVPAINNDGRFGRWAFLEIHDPWNAQTEIRGLLTVLSEPRVARTA